MTQRLLGTQRRHGKFGVVVLSAVLLVACGATQGRGVEVSYLRSIAKRVDGGGVECPLAIPTNDLRPSTVPAGTPLQPLRTDGNSSQGVIGTGLPTKDSVRIWCTYTAGGLRVDVVVAGVTRGHAIAALAPAIAFATDAKNTLTFVNANAQTPVNAPQVIPGQNPAAFVRVEASSGDVGLVLVVTRLDPKAVLPSASEVAKRSESIARYLAE